MKDEKDILAKAIESLKSQQVPPGPPQAVIDATLEKLTDAAQQYPRSISLLEKITNPNNFIKLTTRLAAAAALLVLAGYAIGRLSAPSSRIATADLEQLRCALHESLTASLKPAIRQELLEETNRRLQLALAQNSAELKTELTERYRSDLNHFAIQTLAASNAVTNQLLAQLVQSINAAQTRDLRRVAAALYEIETNRQQDKNQLATGIKTLAYETQGELERTKQEVAQLLVNTQPTGFGPDTYNNPNTPNERVKK